MKVKVEGNQGSREPKLSARPTLAREPKLSARPTFVGRLGVTKRTLQIALGAFWIFDALMQLQSQMFTKAFVNQMILSNAQGQPAPIAWVITTAGRIVEPDVAVWNLLIVLLQIAIGIGLLRQSTVKTALIAMWIWSFTIWWIGEGLGEIFTGKGYALTGAPGAVLIYAVIGIMVWPTSDSKKNRAIKQLHELRTTRKYNLASSPGSSGPLGTKIVVASWSILWTFFAFAWLLPSNRQPSSIHNALIAAASSQPLWYSHFLDSLARDFATNGTQIAWLAALGCLVIAFGPLLTRRLVGFFVAGAILELIFWITGQGVGGLLTGMGTDPNTGPLVAFLAIAAIPRAVPVTQSFPTMSSTFIKASRPGTVGALGAGIGALLLMAATYPAAGLVSASGSTSQLASATSMSAMNMGSSSQSSSTSGSGGVSGASGASGASGSAGKGLSMRDMKTSANSIIPGAMGSNDPSWAYTGPPLTQGLTTLLTTVSHLTDLGHQMQTPSCTTTPSRIQLEDALRLVQQTTLAIAKYKNLSVATANGYIPVTSPDYPVVHYVKPSYMKEKYVLDPNHIQSLVYTFTPYGPVLVAGMYLMPRSNQNGPMPGGCLTQWHAHTNLCYSDATGLIVGFTPCPSGTVNYKTPYMLHVWQVPVPGGPLALDPSDLQVTQSAIMAQQSGEAPALNPIPPSPSSGSLSEPTSTPNPLNPGSGTPPPTKSPTNSPSTSAPTSPLLAAALKSRKSS